MSEKTLDLIVVGGGIAGLSAGLTAARAGLHTLVMTGDVLGGHLLSIERVDGYPGFPEGVPGYDLCPMVQEQAAAAGAHIEAMTLDGLEAADGQWRLTAGTARFVARAVVLATGTRLKTLGLAAEERLRGKGVSHCASCDAPLLRGRVVGVVGGGDSALQEALTLAESASRVVILHRGRAFSAQAAYQQRVTQHPRIEVRFNTVVEDVIGDTVVGGVRTRDVSGGDRVDIELAGLFVYVGLEPNAAVAGGLLELDASGRIVTDAWMQTTHPGMFAAGTVRAGSAGRAVSAAGDGATAAVAAALYVKDGTWRARAEHGRAG